MAVVSWHVISYYGRIGEAVVLSSKKQVGHLSGISYRPCWCSDVEDIDFELHRVNASPSDSLAFLEYYYLV